METIVASVITVAIVLAILGFSAYTVIINTLKNEGMLKAQMEAAKVKHTDHVTTMSYEQVNNIINDLIKMYVANTVLIRGLNAKKSEELSVVLDQTITAICTDVWNAMSDPLKESALMYVTETHLKTLIKDNTRIVLLARLGSR